MIRLTFASTMTVLLLSGCPASNPYGPAKTTINFFKGALDLGDKVAQDSTNEKFKQYWPPAKKTAVAAADLALETIAALESGKARKECLAKYPDEKSSEHQACLQKYATNIAALVKKAVCLCLQAIGFVPEKYLSRFKLYIELGKQFVCPAAAAAPTATPPTTTAPATPKSLARPAPRPTPRRPAPRP